MNSKQQGFTLVELMIVVAIIAILAVIAVPNLIQYTIRAKVSEAITMASAAKTSVSEYYASTGKMPANAGQAGIDITAKTEIVAGIAYNQTDAKTAEVTVTLEDIGGDTGTKTIEFKGKGSPTGVTWTCAGGGTTLADNLLPAQCRG